MKRLYWTVRKYFKLRYAVLGLILLLKCHLLIDTYNLPWKTDPWSKLVDKKFREKLITDKTFFKDLCETNSFCWQGRSNPSEGELLARSASLADLWLDVGFSSFRSYRFNAYTFSQHIVFTVLDNGLERPDYVFVAIGSDSQIHYLWNLESFNNMISEESLHIESDSAVFWLLKAFLTFYFPKLEVILLSSIDDILWDPNSSRDEKYVKIKKMIIPPNIEMKENTYFVKFYSWSAVCGSIVGWEMSVASNGILNVSSRTMIATKIGEFEKIE